MPSRSLSSLIVSVFLLTGCLNTTPSVPNLTETQLASALDQLEQRLTGQVRLHCTGWDDHHQDHLQQYSQLQSGQQEIDARLVALEQSLQQQQRDLVAATTARVTPEPAVCPPPSPASKSLDNKLLVGEVEWLWLEAVNRVYEARVDTGATTSSISAREITPFEKDGKPWVRFQLSPDDSNTSYEIEAPLVRYARIRQSSTEETDRRAVARLTVRMGNLTEVAEFTLTDRSQMSYPILLGREFLRDIAVVDVSRKNVQPKPEIVGGQPEIEAFGKDAQ